MHSINENEWFEALSEAVRTELAAEFRSYRQKQILLIPGQFLTVDQTTKMLYDAGELASKLAPVLDGLSLTATASIFEVAASKGEELSRIEIFAVSKFLAKCAKIFPAAGDEIRRLHSPTADIGQGSGSAMAKEADFLAIKADHGRPLIELTFNKPKDLFAIKALGILYCADALPSPDIRGARKVTVGRLHYVWTQHTPDPLPNWSRVIRHCKIMHRRAAEDHRRATAFREIWSDVLGGAPMSGTRLPKNPRRRTPLATG